MRVCAEGAHAAGANSSRLCATASCTCLQASHKGKKPGESGYASAFSFDSKKGKGGKKELPSALEALVSGSGQGTLSSAEQW